MAWPELLTGFDNKLEGFFLKAHWFLMGLHLVFLYLLECVCPFSLELKAIHHPRILTYMGSRL